MLRILLFIALAGSLASRAQDSTSSGKITFGGLQQFGLAFTEHSGNTLLTLINGIHYKKFFLGVGVDAHFRRRSYFNNMNTSAVFLDLRYYLDKRGCFFVRTDGGTNLITEPRGNDNFASYTYYPGYYGGAGLGVKARLGKEVFYTVDLCYVMKQLRFRQTSSWWWNESATQTFDIRQSIIQLNIGLEIF